LPMKRMEPVERSGAGLSDVRVIVGMIGDIRLFLLCRS